MDKNGLREVFLKDHKSGMWKRLFFIMPGSLSKVHCEKEVKKKKQYKNKVNYIYTDS